MRYLLYARVSPKGSSWAASESSIPTQLAACRQYVLRSDPAATFIEVTDEFESGRDTKRPGFQRVLADLAACRGEWDALVVYSIDRLGRSIGDMLPFFESLHKAGRGLMACRQNIDMASAGGRAMLYLMCVFAQLEREMNSERTTAKMMSIAAGGGIPYGKAPYGYKRVAKSNILAVDPATAPAVLAIFQRYTAGTALDDIAAATGVPRSSVMQILRRPIYKGVIDYGGRTFPGKHPPLIAPALWASAQARLPGPAVPAREARHLNARTYPYLLAGLVRCHCGRSMTPYSVRKTKTGARTWYYKCTDPLCALAVNAKALDTKALAHCRAHPLTVEIVRVQLDELARIRAEELQASVPRMQELSRDLADAQARLTTADEAFLSGIVTPQNAPHWNSIMSAALQKIEVLTAESERLTALQTGAMPDPAEIVAQLEAWGQMLDRADTDDHRRAFLQAHVARVTVAPDKRAQLRLVMTTSDSWLPR